MFQLVYSSRATERMTEKSLLELLQEARQRNAKRSVTGMLLYADGKFIQLLEGGNRDVMDIYASIESDHRHRDPCILLEHEVEHRQFSDWSMGFQNLTPHRYSRIEGYSDFLEQNLDLPQVKNMIPAAIRLLFSFKSLIALKGENQALSS